MNKTNFFVTAKPPLDLNRQKNPSKLPPRLDYCIMAAGLETEISLLPLLKFSGLNNHSYFQRFQGQVSNAVALIQIIRKAGPLREEGEDK